jgi:predicted Zn-dependent protease
MAHVAKRHGVQSVAQAIGVQQLVSLALGDGSLLAAVGGDLMTGLARSSYSRDLEREADREGVKTLLAAGVDPQGLAEFFAIIEQRAGQPNVPEWAGTHPDNAERIARIEQQLDEAPEQDFEPLLEDWENLRQHIRGNQPQ